MDLDSFTADLFSSGSKEMKEVIQLITRLMNLVIGALDQVETQMTRLEGRIGSIESRPAAVVSSPVSPQSHPSAGIPSPPSPQGIPSPPSPQVGGVAEELRSAVTSSPPGGGLPGMPGEAPSGYGAPPTSGPVVEGGGWEAGFEGLAKAPEPAPPPAGGPGGSGLGIRSALQSELKDAFKRLKSSMDEED